MLAVAAELSGADHALDSARTLTAWANGFVGMELWSIPPRRRRRRAFELASVDSPRPLPATARDGGSLTLVVSVNGH